MNKTEKITIQYGTNNKPIIGWLTVNQNGEASFNYGNEYTPFETFVSKRLDKFAWHQYSNDALTNLSKSLYPNLNKADAEKKLKSELNGIFTKLNDERYRQYKDLYPDSIEDIKIPKPARSQTSSIDKDNDNAPKKTDESEIESGGAKLVLEALEVQGVPIRSEYGNYKFPNDIGNNSELDYVQFDQFKYKARDVNLLNFESLNLTTKLKGCVFLPIQSASDTNSVSWNEDFVNPLQAAGAAFGLNLLKSDISKYSEITGATFEKFASELESNGKSELIPAFQMWAAGQAVGLNNLLTRASGAILNNNIELLFNSPQLRQFTFNYSLSPRDQEEANSVRGIIRFFKEGMVVQRTATNLFLKTPNVFKIKYVQRTKTGKKEGKSPREFHPSLNRFKGYCALSNFQTNYTPANTYMTFNDEFSTMTSYTISMTFTELEPLYSDDYFKDNKNIIPIDEIGY